MEILSIVSATALGYFIFRATTHPKSRIRRKLPAFRVKRLQVFPVIRIKVFGRTLHLHHWVNFSLLLALSNFLPGGILDSVVTKGVLLGGVIQGLTLPKGHRKVFPCRCSYCTN